MKRFIVLIIIVFVFCGCAWGSSENDETLMREIKALRGEIAALRQELKLFMAESDAGKASQIITDAARASIIISNLRNLKGACLVHMADNITDGLQLPTDITQLMKYVDNPSEFSKGHYFLEIVSDRLYIGFNAKNAAVSDEVKKELSEYAESFGLTSSTDINAEKYTNQDILLMRVMY